MRRDLARLRRVSDSLDLVPLLPASSEYKAYQVSVCDNRMIHGCYTNWSVADDSSATVIRIGYSSGIWSSGQGCQHHKPREAGLQLANHNEALLS